MANFFSENNCRRLAGKQCLFFSYLTVSKDFPFEGWRIQIYLVLNGRLVRYILKGFPIVRILKTYNCPIGSKRKITINRKL